MTQESTDSKNYYEILGVTRKADEGWIKIKHESLIEGHRKEIELINKAAACLKDKDKRAEYDKSLPAEPENAPQIRPLQASFPGLLGNLDSRPFSLSAPDVISSEDKPTQEAWSLENWKALFTGLQEQGYPFSPLGFEQRDSTLRRLFDTSLFKDSITFAKLKEVYSSIDSCVFIGDHPNEDPELLFVEIPPSPLEPNRVAELRTGRKVEKKQPEKLFYKLNEKTSERWLETLDRAGKEICGLPLPSFHDEKRGSEKKEDFPFHRIVWTRIIFSFHHKLMSFSGHFGSNLGNLVGENLISQNDKIYDVFEGLTRISSDFSAFLKKKQELFNLERGSFLSSEELKATYETYRVFFGSWMVDQDNITRFLKETKNFVENFWGGVIPQTPIRPSTSLTPGYDMFDGRSVFVDEQPSPDSFRGGRKPTPEVTGGNPSVPNINFGKKNDDKGAKQDDSETMNRVRDAKLKEESSSPDNSEPFFIILILTLSPIILYLQYGVFRYAFHYYKTVKCVWCLRRGLCHCIHKRSSHQTNSKEGKEKKK